MGKTLIDIKTEEGKKRALDSTQRLEDFEYDLFSDLNAPSPEDTERHQKEAEQYELEDELDRLYSKKSKKTNKRLKQSKNKEKYRGFLEATIDSGVNVENVLEDISIKKEHLRNIMGYGALKADGGWVPLDNAKDSRIGKTYLNTYNLARRVCNN